MSNVNFEYVALVNSVKNIIDLIKNFNKRTWVGVGVWAKQFIKP